MMVGAMGPERQCVIYTMPSAVVPDTVGWSGSVDCRFCVACQAVKCMKNAAERTRAVHSQSHPARQGNSVSTLPSAIEVEVPSLCCTMGSSALRSEPDI